MPKLRAKVSHVHLDIVGGIAGDMFVAAFLDAFPELEEKLIAQLALILPTTAGSPKIWQAKNGGMSVKRFALTQAGQEDTSTVSEHISAHSHSHSMTGNSTAENHAEEHAHGHSHSHSHGHSHSSDQGSGHTHNDETRFVNLKKRIEQSALTVSVQQHAVGILEILAIAEAKMHATTVEEVHFHELADWDSLMDVVAAAVIIDAVALESFSMSKLPVGGGLVKTQHGLLPVPAPATAEILRGFEFFDDGVAGERITPTGAAILRYLQNSVAQTTVTEKILQVSGYGAGARSFKELPNILRVMGYADSRADDSTQLSNEAVLLIEFDIDDMTGEELAVAVDQLRQTSGLIDITTASLRGKKQRAMERVCILAEISAFDSVVKACFIQTTTLGVRHQIQQRKIISREHSIVRSANYDQSFDVKRSRRPDGRISVKVESDDLQQFSSLAERRHAKYSAELASINDSGEKDV